MKESLGVIPRGCPMWFGVVVTALITSRCPLWVNQPGQLSLPSFLGR